MSRSTRIALGAFLGDLVIVLAFATIGRASHAEGLLGDGGVGLMTTAWPFIAALGIAWLVTLAWRRPTAPLRTGVPVWIVTVAVTMLFRALSGQGTALSFVIVTAVSLGAFLVGWRLVAFAVSRRRRVSA
ncbi:DUF3054 domain-containing protein [Agromyces atrinae]|uniref:DUF3054 domain-containing protein n=1 Tax=Agromyces atrinae TaxID=592376 RepID=A0A4Q2M9D3_9MICO|nr:DUF3054 domain-containing protein [Agromyces atrinae]NYD66306.1 Zn-dependent protease with chaperone function [Agromyces atrinae]RXZ86631.1 DUF3054 domain-containing protein [Agromyces atrinae]